MKRYLLDTNMAGLLMEKRRGVYDKARSARRQGGRIGIGIPVLAELYYGVEFSSSREKNLKRLERAVSGLTIWPFDQNAAAEFGRLRAELRRRGAPVPQDYRRRGLCVRMPACNKTLDCEHVHE